MNKLNLIFIVIIIGSVFSGCSYLLDIVHTPQNIYPGLGMYGSEFMHVIQNEYPKSELFVGFPEDVFVKWYTKINEYVDKKRPFILSEKNHVYKVGLRTSEFFRITFRQEKLIKYQEYIWEDGFWCLMGATEYLHKPYNLKDVKNPSISNKWIDVAKYNQIYGFENWLTQYLKKYE